MEENWKAFLEMKGRFLRIFKAVHGGHFCSIVLLVVCWCTISGHFCYD